MGRRGPRPRPTHLKLLMGNPGKRPINPEPEPAFAAVIPDPPEFLKGYAADEWRRIAEELYRLKLLTVVDIYPLAAYCEAYGMWRTSVETYETMAANDPATHGLIVRAKNGTILQNPIVLSARQAAKDMVRYASEFGFTPAARSRIAAGDDESPVSKFGRLLAH
jgi:P27 family predicted phage terminase small subunit